MHAAVSLNDGRILILGGSGSYAAVPGSVPLVTLNTADLYDPAANSWSRLPSMHYPRAFPTGTLLPDGLVLVVGDEGVNEGTAELFDPESGRWSDAPPPGLRAETVAVALANGDVLVAGGVGQSSARLFDWRRNVWVDAGEMHAVRASATGIRLANGDVLVTGGFGNLAYPFASAEIYDPRGQTSVAMARARSQPGLLVGITPVAGGIILLLVMLAWLLNQRRHGHPDQWVTFPASKAERFDT